MTSKENSICPEETESTNVYTITFDTLVKKQLIKLPQKTQIQIISKIEKLAIDPRPHGVKKLRGARDDYRIRVGDYRIIYQIQDSVLVILILEVGHRKDIYRD